MVTKNIPVYHWRQSAPNPCNEPEPIPDYKPEPKPDYKPEPPMPKEKVEVDRITYEAPKRYDADGDGKLDAEERAKAEADGNLKVKVEKVSETLESNQYNNPVPPVQNQYKTETTTQYNQYNQPQPPTDYPAGRSSSRSRSRRSGRS